MAEKSDERYVCNKIHLMRIFILITGMMFVLCSCALSAKEPDKDMGQKLSVQDVEKRILEFDKNRVSVKEIKVDNLFDYMEVQMFQVAEKGDEDMFYVNYYLLNQEHEVRLIDAGKNLNSQEHDTEFLCEDMDGDGEYELAYAANGRTSGVASANVFIYHVEKDIPTLEHVEGFRLENYGAPVLSKRGTQYVVKNIVEDGDYQGSTETDLEEQEEMYPLTIVDGKWKIIQGNETYSEQSIGDSTEMFLREIDPDDIYFYSAFQENTYNKAHSKD